MPIEIPRQIEEIHNQSDIGTEKFGYKRPGGERE
jgi:hypothetical protein